ncbi:glucose-6-phosphate dehydrogenase [Chitinispirillales bacterium ANBcel5]|uniref:glucose-6-phosphate dehydrogenase n=1 Tax=Cellulosispirillum alkaliphilum TaxID=3039283 RepID=UPI002A4F3FEF|nr:glucose-6-phosphate dehydrogenase [Chitinispirillales bacterium ANBcel5]
MALKNIAIVIMGASGDLARRKLIPALHALFLQGKIDTSSIVVGSGRTHFTDEQFRNRFGGTNSFQKQLYYHQYISGLKEFIASKGEFSKVVVFLSQPPAAYTPTARELLAEGFGAETSIVIEKPFGYDYRSAKALNSELEACFSESQIYRIDHYLAKEAVRNILVFRYANSIFYPVWNSRYIESIQINALETDTISHRGNYFDRAGIIRDMVQNHLLQLLCLLTMEAPVSLDAHDIRAQKLDILRTLRVDECHRFQYSGYRSETGVKEDSNTETFAELKLFVNNFRWTGIPIYIRSGKAMHRRGTEIGVRFKSLPKLLFNAKGELKENHIIFKIQPAEGIILDLSTKIPGSDDNLTDTHMNFCYKDTFSQSSPEAYQKLLYDVLKGDHTLFVSAKETECAWALFEDVLNRGELYSYSPGSRPPTKFDLNWIEFDNYSSLCL